MTVVFHQIFSVSLSGWIFKRHVFQIIYIFFNPDFFPHTYKKCTKLTVKLQTFKNSAIPYVQPKGYMKNSDLNKSLRRYLNQIDVCI